MPCTHLPPCPYPDGPDGSAARMVASHPEQGWYLLCNGLVLFEDGGAVLPSGRTLPAHRCTDDRVLASAA